MDGQMKELKHTEDFQFKKNETGIFTERISCLSQKRIVELNHVSPKNIKFFIKHKRQTKKKYTIDA